MQTQPAPDLSKLSLGETPETFPATSWLTYVNGNPGWTYIVVPSAGTLWVNYTVLQSAKQIYVFHQGGSTTPINVGENTIQVGAGDVIVYQLSNPGTDSIKLNYQMI